MVAAGLALSFGCSDTSTNEPAAGRGPSITDILSTDDTGSYRRATRPFTLRFPWDHGAHPEFKHEWWYFTGNVVSKEGHRFGYQFTLFRSALTPQPRTGPSAWTTNQIYMGHLAVTDVNNGSFYHDERFARGAMGLAGVTTEPFRAWLEDWSAIEAQPTALACNECLRLTITAVHRDFRIAITVANNKPMVRHGVNGWSQKSETPTNASYYYSYTRMTTEGAIRVNGRDHSVSGLSWFDHEWSTSFLESNHTGWDWFSLQLSTDSELMLFRMRDRERAARDYLSGSFIDRSGGVTPLAGNDFEISALATWKSLKTGIIYPSGWRIEAPGHGLSLTVSPWINDQEITSTFRYWEGAVSVKGRLGEQDVTGSGYVELTGYD